MSVVLLATYFFGRKEEENEDNSEEAQKRRNSKLIVRLASLLPTIAAIVTFILTEDMSNPMVMFDGYTWVMAVIAVVQVGVMFLSKKTEEEEEANDAA